MTYKKHLKWKVEGEVKHIHEALCNFAEDLETMVTIMTGAELQRRLERQKARKEKLYKDAMGETYIR